MYFFGSKTDNAEGSAGMALNGSFSRYFGAPPARTTHAACPPENVTQDVILIMRQSSQIATLEETLRHTAFKI